VRLELDHEACQGHGRCYTLAPDLFASDDDGFAVLMVAEPPPDSIASARNAVRSCPERAITES